MSLSIRILGCGSSGGVPRVAQGWGACDPHNPRNRRRRCAILVSKGAPGAPEVARTQVLIDMGPDLREQLIDAGVTRLDGILLTHAHADHTHGMDDVRPLTIQHAQRLPVYMDAPTAADVLEKFGYIFQTPPGSQYPPLLIDNRIHHGVGFRIDGPGGPIDFLPIEVVHGDIVALGFRFDGVAYLPDVSVIPEESLRLFSGLDLWILDALRYTLHPSHINVAQALDYIARLGARRAILTNLHTDLDYARLSAELPPGISAAYDGMTVEA